LDEGRQRHVFRQLFSSGRLTGKRTDANRAWVDWVLLLKGGLAMLFGQETPPQGLTATYVGSGTCRNAIPPSMRGGVRRGWRTS
jgi:hypothetical protein